MPKELNGDTYYRTNEVCELVGISRSTLLAWLDKGVLDTVQRDRNRWRLFSSQDIKTLKARDKYQK